MSILRLSGIVLALFFFLIIFLRLRKHSDSRFDIAILSIFGVSLFLVSLFPSFVNLPAEILSLDKSERGRLLTLLIISTLALWLLHIYERGKPKYLALCFDRLVRTLTVERFFKTPRTFQEEAILIIIPAYNEEENLLRLIPDLPKEVLGKQVVPLVVDDGSTDNTSGLCSNLGVPLAQNLINRGGGAALRTGFDIAREFNTSIIVIMDGDGQHRPEDIEKLVGPVLNDQADLVIGSRLLGEMEQYSKLRYWGVVLFGRMISFLLGQKVTDPASGFRALNLNLLETCVLVQDQYHTAELIIETAKHGFKIKEQPIVIKERISGISKKGQNVKYALYFLKTIVKTWTR